MWAEFKVFFHCEHRDQWRVVAMVKKGGYTEAVINIYGVPSPTTPEDNNKANESLYSITKIMQDQKYDMDGQSQENTVLTSSNTMVMAQLTQLTYAMGEMQEQMKNISTSTKTKSKYYFWVCNRNLNHDIRSCPNKKAGHKYDTHYWNRMGSNKKICE